MSQAEQAQSVSLRQVALAQAAHDLKGSGKPEEAVKRAEVYLAFLSASPKKASGVTDAQIKHMVERFLGWKLPADFNPDGGISFESTGNAGTPYEFRREPLGTNLLDLHQTAEMIRYITADLPSA